MKLQKISNKGFTLVELMIVVAIIGVLAATLLPQLQGAQARARDAGRAASLNNISAVLSTYFSDEGQYPEDGANGLAAAANCVSSDSGAVNDASAKLLFKGSLAPVNPQKTATSGNCQVKGAYAYNHLTKDGITKSAFVLMSDVESFKKSNLTVRTQSAMQQVQSGAGASTKAFAKIMTGNADWVWGKPTAEQTTGLQAKGTVFAIVQ